MNCARCKTLLPPDAKYCRVCGLSVTPASGDHAINTSPVNAPTFNNSPTLQAPSLPPRTSPQAPLSPLPPQQQWASTPQGQLYQSTPPYYQSPASVSPPGTLPATGGKSASTPAKHRRGGCLPKILITLVILAALLIGGWFLALRPYLHSQAQSQIEQSLSSSINQIPPVLPPVKTLSITDTMINNLIVLNHSPSDPVQDEQVTITHSGLILDFQVYNFSCSVEGNLALSNGNLVVTNLAIQGILGLIMSPDELTSILNSQLASVQSHIHRSLSSITLEDHEIDIILGGVTI
jgi:hypothetical protein